MRDGCVNFSAVVFELIARIVTVLVQPAAWDALPTFVGFRVAQPRFTSFAKVTRRVDLQLDVAGVIGPNIGRFNCIAIDIGCKMPCRLDGRLVYSWRHGASDAVWEHVSPRTPVAQLPIEAAWFLWVIFVLLFVGVALLQNGQHLFHGANAEFKHHFQVLGCEGRLPHLFDDV